jgi:hypothetical protein
MSGGEDGLGGRHRPAPAKRPAASTGVVVAALTAPAFAKLEIKSHRMLALKQAEIAARVNADPRWGVMLMINPVLAFKDVGVNVSTEVAAHILHAIQHPVDLRKRRVALEASLLESLGETPRPNDAKWVASILFNLLKLHPLDSLGHEPVYSETLAGEAIRKAATLRPLAPPRPRYPEARHFSARNLVGVAPWREAVRRIDVDAPLPKLGKAKSAPNELPIEQLYFYKDSHPLAKALLELAIIQRRGFPIQTPDAYRKIRDGVKANAFRTWITSVRFNSGHGKK